MARLQAVRLEISISTELFKLSIRSQQPVHENFTSKLPPDQFA